MSALWSIQTHLASGTLSQDLPQTFWIDAICINQADPEEKGPQISMMREVYSAAATVISWLGYDDASITSAFDFMRKVNKAGDASKKHSAKGIELIHCESETQSNATAANALMDTVADPRFLFLLSLSESVIDFFSLPYWHRVWIVQEVTSTKPESNLIIFDNELITFRDVQIFRDDWLRFLRGLERNQEWHSVLYRMPGWESRRRSWERYLNRMEESLVVWSYYDFMRGVSGDSLLRCPGKRVPLIGSTGRGVWLTWHNILDQTSSGLYKTRAGSLYGVVHHSLGGLAESSATVLLRAHRIGMYGLALVGARLVDKNEQ